MFIMQQKKGKKSIQERVQELASILEDGVTNFSYTPEEYKALLEMKALMPYYSFRNIMVAKAQFPHASYLASLKRWNELGRKVKKGAKAIRIFAPRFKKVEDENGEEKTELIGFIPVPVFDVAQTEGEPLPIDKVFITLEGDSPEARNIIECAEILARNDNCPVTYGDAKGANGFYVRDTHEIVVDESLSINHRCKTLVHELVHSRVHRYDTTASTSEKEVVAEGTAFIVCSYFGLDTSNYSFRYVHAWRNQKDENPLMNYGPQICNIAGQLIKDFQELKQKLKVEKEQRLSTHIA